MSISSIGGGGTAWPQAWPVSAASQPDPTRRPEAAQGGSAAAGANADDKRASGGPARESDLSEAERRQLAELKQRDREVRAHEMAHVAAGAGLVTGGASYSYQTGPDGQRYAIGGEVSIDVSPGSTPEETLDKADRIRAAALAPADPSGQDRQVAAQATRMATEARMEIARREFEQTQEGQTGTDAGGPQDAAATDNVASYRGQQAERAYTASASPASDVRAAA